MPRLVELTQINSRETEAQIIEDFEETARIRREMRKQRQIANPDAMLPGKVEKSGKLMIVLNVDDPRDENDPELTAARLIVGAARNVLILFQLSNKLPFKWRHNREIVQEAMDIIRRSKSRIDVRKAAFGAAEEGYRNREFFYVGPFGNLDDARRVQSLLLLVTEFLKHPGKPKGPAKTPPSKAKR